MCSNQFMALQGWKIFNLLPMVATLRSPHMFKHPGLKHAWRAWKYLAASNAGCVSRNSLTFCCFPSPCQPGNILASSVYWTRAGISKMKISTLDEDIFAFIEMLQSRLSMDFGLSYNAGLSVCLSVCLSLSLVLSLGPPQEHQSSR